ncbi:MAG: hypothetical protein V4592_00435 [Bacteroidota bacterium]
MIKYGFWIALVCFGVACGHTSSTTVQENRPNDIKGDEPIAPKLLIVPGAGIGYIKLNENADSVVKAMGKPDKQDAAMGAMLMTWYNSHDTTRYQTTIYAHHNFGAKDEAVSHVKMIRITSPLYQTSKWAHVGFPLDSLQKLYHPNKNSRSVYDDVKAGIAFELGASNRCSAIIVHAPGDSSGAYLDTRQ